MAATLPVFATVGTAYRLVWRHAGRLAGISWPLMAVYVIQQMIVLYMRRVDLVAGEQTVLAVCGLIAIVLAIPVATSAYRLFLLGESARISLGFGREEGLYVWASLRFGFRYILVSLAVGVAVTVVALGLRAAGVPLPIHERPGVGFIAVAALLGLVVLLALSIYLARFLLIFPAAATGRSLTLKQAAWYARELVWRLWLAVFIAAASVMLLNGVANLVLGVLSNGWPTVVAAPVRSMILAFISILLLLLSTAVLSIAYRALVDDADAQAPPPLDLAPGPAD